MFKNALAHVLHKTVVVALHKLKFYKNYKKRKISKSLKYVILTVQWRKESTSTINYMYMYTHTSTMCWSLCQYSSVFYWHSYLQIDFYIPCRFWVLGSSKRKALGAEVHLRELRESIRMAIVTWSAQKEMQMVETIVFKLKFKR